MRGNRFDIAVIGGSLGGVQTARAACEMGKRVYLCEETDWIGGQLTAQAVPPDEHAWIEDGQGATASYLQYRQAVRAHYRAMENASDLMKHQDRFCPGHSWVSRLAHDPRVAHQLLWASLLPYEEQGLLTVALNTKPVGADVRDDRIMAVTVRKKDGTEEYILADYFLDATDTGELLPLTGTAYRIGAEGKAETGEAHAAENPDPLDQQPITWVAALTLEKQRPDMRKPDSFDDFRQKSCGGHPMLGWDNMGGGTGPRFYMFDDQSADRPLGLWSYRRIQYAPYYTDDRPEATLLNWPQNDYIFGNVIDCPDGKRHLELARELTKCCAYWLWEQGYPVRLAGEFVGTEDGLAKAPYIRESRRIKAKKLIVEEDVAAFANPIPRRLKDSVGTGHYALDLHYTTKTHTQLYEPAQRFEIPLSAMIPEKMKNLLPACKNIGASHVASGCFRLHPEEWTVGEAAGYLSSYCLDHGCAPEDVLNDRLIDFQSLLIQKGFQLHWREETKA